MLDQISKAKMLNGLNSPEGLGARADRTSSLIWALWSQIELLEFYFEVFFLDFDTSQPSNILELQNMKIIIKSK